MRRVTILLSIILLTGCQATRHVVEYKYIEIVNSPSANYLNECITPFNAPPTSFGAAVVRDEIWLNAFRSCACLIEKNRAFYGFNNSAKQCEALTR